MSCESSLYSIGKKFPNQQPWIYKNICDALNIGTAPYNSGLNTGNMDDCKAASYNVREAVWEAKWNFRENVKSQKQQCDHRGIRQKLRTTTDSKRYKLTLLVSAKVCLAD